MRRERWSAIAGFNGRYEVSDHGRVRSLPRKVRNRWGIHWRRGSELKPRPRRHGYLAVALFNGKGVRREISVHILVATAFVFRPNGTEEVNHDDGIKTRNIHSNLKWTTHLGNVQHSIQTGLRKRRFTAHQVRDIRAGFAVTGCSDSMARHIRARRRYADVAE
jgi:hypothetical protein